MNLNLQEGVALAKELNAALTADKPNCDVVICTPFIHLASVAGELTEGLVGLGAENCADKASGAYTGEVSAAMVKSTGAQYVILGHSERRAYYGETEEILKEKINLALANGLKVIFCIGEVLEERESGKQNEVVKAQLEGSLFDLSVEEFSNIILADEINRATPKTQSALLEAMQEHTVTVMGVSRKLNEPFFVLATQNPIEQDGTYPLPEAQMDRFMFKIIVKNPSLDELMDIVNMTQKTMAEVADAACTGEQLLEMRKTANAIPVAEEVMKYAMMLCSATHPDSEHAAEASKKYIRLGASPRAGQALISAAKVKALMNGRYNVAYSDINELALPVLRHRIKLTFEAVAERVGADEIVTMIVDELMVRNKLKEETPKAVETTETDKKAKKFGRK